jgi:MSHA biogenesis protein MshK
MRDTRTNKNGYARRLIALFAAVLTLATVSPAAAAQALSDPMQPPPDRTASVAPAAPSASGLQVVITSPDRKLALIDGSVVPLGGAVREGTLAGMSDSAAVLRKNGEHDVLFMHPNIEKRPVRREVQ